MSKTNTLDRNQGRIPRAAPPTRKGASSWLPSNPFFNFQKAAGNQSTQRFLQCKLAINAPGDVHEREADRIADAVVSGRDIQDEASTGAGMVQRACSGGGTCEHCGPSAHQVSSVTNAPPVVDKALSSPGQPLEPEIRGFMEDRFGQDFSRVRVHTDAKAMESTKAVNALAYTVGNDVVFSSGQYSPRSLSGRRLLAHELAHTVQQHGGAASLQRYKVEDCDPKENPLELPSTVDDAHKRGLDMLSNAIVMSANSADPAVQAAAQKNFNITLPAPDSFTQYLWDRARHAMDTMKNADSKAVYECEPKQNWWNGGCIKGNVAVSLFNIHLCPLWWQRYTTVDCRASVLVHEWGHKWGKGVNRIFETYHWEPKFKKMGPKDRVKMPDAYAGFAYELYTGSPWTC